MSSATVRVHRVLRYKQMRRHLHLGFPKWNKAFMAAAVEAANKDEPRPVWAVYANGPPLSSDERWRIQVQMEGHKLVGYTWLGMRVGFDG